MSKHPHYGLIVQWASDPERWGVQRFCTYSKSWFLTANHKYPTWSPDQQYRLIDRYAEPITDEPAEGFQYWVSRPDLPELALLAVWTGSPKDKHRLAHGLCYRIERAAEARSREIIESGGGEV